MNSSWNASEVLVSPAFLLGGQSIVAGTLALGGPVEFVMNGLLAWSIWAEPKLHSRGSKLLFLLSCADGTLGLLNTLSGAWFAGRLAGLVGQSFAACLRLDIGLRMAASFASTLLMLSLALDRWQLVFRPLSYFSASDKATERVVVGWAVAALFAVLLWLQSIIIKHSSPKITDK